MYTEEENAVLSQYPTKSVQELATLLNKTERSIIGKLSRMGIYQKKVYVTKSGEKPISKLELRSEIEKVLGCTLEGLEKAPKSTLAKLKAAI